MRSLSSTLDRGNNPDPLVSELFHSRWTAARGPRLGSRDDDEGLMTHAMPGSRDLRDRELLEVVLLQCRQDTGLETLVVPDEHAYVCAGALHRMSER
jgi:hypothetical protein